MIKVHIYRENIIMINLSIRDCACAKIHSFCAAPLYILMKGTKVLTLGEGRPGALAIRMRYMCMRGTVISGLVH